MTAWTLSSRRILFSVELSRWNSGVPLACLFDMPIPSPFSRCESQTHGLRLLRSELLEGIALDRPLPNDHQPQQPFRLLAHRLRVRSALVPRHRRRVHADLRSEVSPRETQELP